MRLQRPVRYILTFIGMLTVVGIYFFTSKTTSQNDTSGYEFDHKTLTGDGDIKRYNDILTPLHTLTEMSWEDVQKQRKNDISDGCKMLYGYNASTPWNIKDIQPFRKGHTFVDQKNKIMYCTIAKAGCTNLKKMMIIQAGGNPKLLKDPEFKVHTRVYDKSFGLKNLETFTSSQIADILKTYRKVTFVRDPFERIVSAYRDKFEKQDDDTNLFFKKKYGTHIVETQRKNPTVKSLKRGHDVKFEEFVKHLIDTYSKETHNNPHWDRFETLCAPCHIQYNIIGKLESFHDDVKHVFPINTLNKYDKISSKSTRSSNSSSKDYVAKYFDQVPKYLVKKLYKAYEKDFLIYGYRLNMDLFN